MQYANDNKLRIAATITDLKLEKVRGEMTGEARSSIANLVMLIEEADIMHNHIKKTGDTDPVIIMEATGDTDHVIIMEEDEQ